MNGIVGNALQGLIRPDEWAGQIKESYRQGQEEARQRKTENALRDYVMSKVGDNQQIGAIAEADPRLAMQVQQQEAAAQASAREQQMKQMPVLGRLLSYAKQGPQQWAEAISTAQSYGMDVSRVPQQFDPAWADTQIMFAQAMQDPQTLDKLPAMAQEVMLSLPPDQRDVNNPAFVQGMSVQLRKLYPLQPGGGMAGINPATGQAEMVITPNPGGFSAGAPAGGGGGNMPRVSSPQEAAQLPPGTQFMMPDGRIGTVPGGPTPQASGGFPGR